MWASENTEGREAFEVLERRCAPRGDALIRATLEFPAPVIISAYVLEDSGLATRTVSLALRGAPASETSPLCRRQALGFVQRATCEHFGPPHTWVWGPGCGRGKVEPS
eukprot:15430474-Alexandrium_andersonii.AAC.1